MVKEKAGDKVVWKTHGAWMQIHSAWSADELPFLVLYGFGPRGMDKY